MKPRQKKLLTKQKQGKCTPVALTSNRKKMTAKQLNMLPEVGSFGTDTAERVLGAKLCANSIIVTIEWHTR